MGYGNPVAQNPIRPPGSPFILGSFRVTAAFGAVDASHPAVNPDGTRGHQGVDFGNGRSGEPILALEAGTVSLAGLIGAAKVVRVKHANGDESGYAHLNTIEVKVGQLVARGQRIGTLGSTGATAAHLHLGLKRGGVEIDSWPLLDQNEVTDMLKGTIVSRVVNRKGFVLGDNTRFRAGPSTTDPILAQYPSGTELYPDYIVAGAPVSGSPNWYGVWVDTPQGRAFTYTHVSLVSALAPIEQSGHTDAELIGAAKRASYNAATDVSAMAAATAAKYPKP